MKTALIVLAEGFEETEAVTIIDVLRRGNIKITAASLGDTEVSGAHDIKVLADTRLDAVKGTLFDAVILPGGMGGTNNLLASDAVAELLTDHAQKGSIVSAICAAPLVLEQAGLLSGRAATIYPGLDDKLTSVRELAGSMVVEDGTIITSKGPGTAMEFALYLLERLAGKMMADQVAGGLLYERQ